LHPDERDDFWVAYFIISYQCPHAKDLDPIFELQNYPWQGVSLAHTADCLNSPVCPPLQTGNDPPIITQTVPAGGEGAFIFMETIRDFTAKWTTQTIGERLTAPHELGHLFGVDGDEPGTLWKIMGYPRFDIGETDSVEFHPEHINIIRSRVRSPGR